MAIVWFFMGMVFGWIILSILVASKIAYLYAEIVRLKQEKDKNEFKHFQEDNNKGEIDRTKSQPIKSPCSDWEGDATVSSDTVCKNCGREKWEH